MDETELDKLAFRFFKTFAQYESTLKERGFIQPRDDERIMVDWNRFAKEVVGSGFLEGLSDKAEAAEYILASPPMKQVVGDDGKIAWREVPNSDRSVQALFGHICRIRNNLFHGAKFNGTWFAPERSNELLRSGLIILEHYRCWLEM